ncbi:hypothetical protein [Streptomyces sp. SP17KL33]|uniref:hypothetical protein n=1 Tax=Streptomyces sp. SP17KL33 TaxID=3002534 RepID=UPI002E785B07|nr:hypothetical protein [Streptomyces sp. SP17KL33]MEE1831574.1 hypothetical protein [Streptomyces sp. SP17KL33]
MQIRTRQARRFGLKDLPLAEQSVVIHLTVRRARCPELDTAAEHVGGFGEILAHRLGHTLPAWIEAVSASQMPGLKTP